MIDTIDHELQQIHDLVNFIKLGDLESASKLLDGPIWREDLEAILHHFGFIILGEGAYSIVCQLPGDATVIKINYANYDPWVIYAKYCRLNHARNPMLPVINELYVNPDSEMGIARMEKLSFAEINRSCGMAKLVRVLSADIQKLELTKRGLRDRTLKYLKSMFDFGYKGSYSRINLAKIVVWMANVRNEHFGVEADCHLNNWMVRGNELVLIDPIA